MKTKAGLSRLDFHEIDLKNLIESIPCMVYYLDKDLNLLAYNSSCRAFFSLIGCYEPEVGIYLPAYYPEEKRKPLLKKFDASAAGRPFVFEDDFILNNSIYHFDTTIYSLPNKDGSLHGYCVRLKDITEQKFEVHALFEAKENYRRLFQFNPLSMYLADPENFKIIEVNQKAMLEYGYSKEEFLSMTLLDITPYEEREKLIAFYYKLRNGEHPDSSVTWVHKDKQGKDVFMEISYHKSIYNGKTVIVSIAKNVTDKIVMERKLEEEKLLRQQQITEAVLDAQENERSAIGRELHDNVNQILGVIPLYISMAQQHADRRDEFLNVAVENVTNAIEEIKKLSKKLVTPFLEVLGLEEAVKNLVDEITLAYPIDIELVFSDFDEAAISDKFKLNVFRIIQEQLNNIMKHANATKVCISLSFDGSKMKLEVTDDGKGFDTTRKSKGVGVFNIKSRAELYKGTVGFISSPGRGCKLKIVFATAS